MKNPMKNQLILLPTTPLDELSDDEWAKRVAQSRKKLRKVLHPDRHPYQNKYSKDELTALFILMEATHDRLLLASSAHAHDALASSMAESQTTNK